jgi:hypothetical protein
MTLASAPSPSRTLQVLGVLCPVAATAIAGPFTMGALEAPGQEYYFLVAPTAAGVVAAPGYLYALLWWRSIPSLAAGLRWWVRLSFLVVILAAMAGAVFGLVLILPSIACMLTVLNALVAWRRMEGSSSSLQGRPAREVRA